MIKFLRACGTGLTVGLLHAFLLGVLSVLYFFGCLFLSMIWPDPISTRVTAGLVYLGYAGIWYFIWRVMYEEGQIRFFYPKLGFALLPLLLAVLLYHPVPADPNQASMMLVDIPIELIRSSILTALILLPIYSIGLYRFVFPCRQPKRKFALLTLCLLLVGSAVYSVAWRSYKTVALPATSPATSPGTSDSACNSSPKSNNSAPTA
ncbi:hypothetical protein [Tumebacillus flagellatus]|uniref:Uncharacterized protein n=1 Tax=Tumebacillus flagellatus TaxID=1157490 RepID=A0A074LPJ3_9BACL|nr:hypothetical protein [Tumebacillus flagellatus]KEO82415.1 hypothetical protein EL26_15150 [Tumebacillus flagellatus]